MDNNDDMKKEIEWLKEKVAVLEDAIRCNNQWTEQIRSEIYKRIEMDCFQTGKHFQEKHEMIMAEHQSILDVVRSQMLEYFKSKTTTDELAEVLKYVENNSIRMIPYSWFDEYMNDGTVIEHDGEWMYTVCHGKKFYFPKSYSKEKAIEYFRVLMAEQDDRSPHRYFDSSYEIPIGCVLIDVGAAEGLIGISNIDSVKKLILIECDPGWIEALKKTCEPYANKIEIVDKLASDKVSDTETTISALTKEPDVYTIKIDVEGYEKKVLKGIDLEKLQKNSKIAVCAYHHQEDQAMIEAYCKDNMLNYSTSKGYVLSTWGGYREPYVRRGVIKIVV